MVAVLAGLTACTSSVAVSHPSAVRKVVSVRRAATATTNPPELTAHLTRWSLPAPVAEPVALEMSGSILILGGITAGGASSDAVLSVEPSSGAVLTPGQLEEPVYAAAGAVLGTTAFVFGGQSYAPVAAVQAWDGAGAAVLSGNLPAPRSELSAAVVASTAYLLGGFDGPTVIADVLASQDGAHFAMVGELPEPVGYGAVAVDGAGGIWVAGGDTGPDGTTATDDIQRFDPATGASSVVGHLPVAVGHAAAFFLDGYLYVAGGLTGTGPVSTIWRFDPTTGQVSAAGSLPGPRYDAGSVMVGRNGYLVGGYADSPSAPLSTVVQLSAG